MFRRRKAKFTLNKEKRNNLNDENKKKIETNSNDAEMTTSSKNDANIDKLDADKSDVFEVDHLRNNLNEKDDDKAKEVPVIKTTFSRRRKTALAPKINLSKKNSSSNKNEKEKNALNEISKISDEAKNKTVIDKVPESKFSRRCKAVIAPKTTSTDVSNNSLKSKDQEESSISAKTEKNLKKDEPTARKFSRRHKAIIAPKLTSKDVDKDQEENISQNESMAVSTIIPCDTNTEENQNHTSIQSIIASFNQTIENNVVDTNENVIKDSVEDLGIKDNKSSSTSDDILTTKLDCTAMNDVESTKNSFDGSEISHLDVNTSNNSLVSTETANMEPCEDVEASNQLRRKPTAKTRKRSLKNDSNEHSERKHKIKVKKKLQEIEEKIGAEGKWPQLDYDVFSMSDFIYLNPTKSAGKEMGIRVRQREQQRKLEEAKKHLAAVQESNKKENLKVKSKSRRNTSVPQLRVDEHGKIILDSDSIEVQTHEIDESQEIIDASSIVINSNSYRRKPVSKRTTWTEHQTRDFYEAVKIVGLDFNLMKSMFKNRSEDELRRKYRLESKRNPEKIDSTLKKQHFVDVPVDKFTHSSSNDKNSSFVEDFKDVALDEDKKDKIETCQPAIGEDHKNILPVITNISSPSK